MKIKFEREWSCYGDRSNGKEGHVEHRNTGRICTFPGCGLPHPELPYSDWQDNPSEVEKKNYDITEPAVSGGVRSKHKHKSDKDKVLFTALSILNLGSGYTTMVGAAQIFPGILGYVSGGIIQVVLFLLLSGSTANHAPIRKWLTVSIFSFISVYTSFFAYYDRLTAKEVSEKGVQRALVARQEVRSEVLAPLENDVRRLEGEIEQLKVLFEREVGGFRGSDEGEGPRARDIRVQVEQKEFELARLKPSVEEFQEQFSSSTLEDSPRSIFQKTIQVLESIPNEYRPPEYQGDLNNLRPLFFDEDTGIPLLTPYRKVTKGEDSAIAAMLLAMGVDGLIIVLGTAIEKRKRFEVEVYVPLKGKASNFLQVLHDHIDPVTGLINHLALMNHPEKEGFRVVLDSMRHKALRWVEVRSDGQDRKWYVSPKLRDTFNHWYQEERQYQSALEAKYPSYSSHSVAFFFPSRK